MKSYPVEVTISVKRNGNEHDLLVKCDVTPGSRGNTYGPPDSWEQPSGPEVSIGDVLVDDGKCDVAFYDSLTESEENDVIVLAEEALGDAIAKEYDESPESDGPTCGYDDDVVGWDE